MSRTPRTDTKALEWNDLAVLLAVCRAGSLSGASRSLGQDHSTVFRRVNAIEEKTGVRFFERLPHGYEMTDAGATVLQYAERIEAEVHALGREVLGQDLRLQGKVRVTAPEGFAVCLAPKLFSEFRRRNPEVTLEIAGGPSAFDLSRREADIAIRATRKPPDASLGRKVCAFRFAVYASARYLAGRERVPLTDHDWCFLLGTEEWLVPLIWKKRQLAQSRMVFGASSSLAVLNATAEGMGLTCLPCYLADVDERLVRVGAPLEPLTLELWLLTHPDLRHTARVKALMAFLYEELGRERALFEGTRSTRGDRLRERQRPERPRRRR